MEVKVQKSANKASTDHTTINPIIRVRTSLKENLPAWFHASFGDDSSSRCCCRGRRIAAVGLFSPGGGSVSFAASPFSARRQLLPAPAVASSTPNDDGDYNGDNNTLQHDSSP
jgi:hypothetical protein